jgi:putative transposase
MYGSPRVLADLVDDGVTVTKKTVEVSMVRQGFWGRRPQGYKKGLTRRDKRANPIKDLLKRDFAADERDLKWCGDFKQFDTLEGPQFLSWCEDLFGWRMLGFAFSDTYRQLNSRRPRSTSQ